MKRLLFSLLVVGLQGAAYASDEDYSVSYDYCSLSHSLHVLDRLDQEMHPIFAKYEVVMNEKQCPFSRERMGTVRD